MSTTESERLLQVLKLAVRYQVESCTTCICNTLSPEVDLKLAITFLNFPPKHFTEDVQKLKEVAITCAVAHFKDLHKHRVQVLQLSLYALQQVLSRDDVEVPTEDELYEFIQTWIQTHNSTHEEPEIFKALIPLLKLSAMRCSTLQNILQKYNYDVAVVAPVVEAFNFKIRKLHGIQGELGRRYTVQPVRTLKFQQPLQRVEVYMDIEAWALQASRTIRSEAFYFNGSGFTLSVTPSIVQRDVFLHLLVTREVQTGQREIYADYSFAIRQPETKEFEDVNGGTYLFETPICGIFKNTLGSNYVLPNNMIGHTLYIKVTLTLKEAN